MPLKSATCGRELEAGLRRRPGSNNVTFDGKPLDGVFVMHRIRSSPTAPSTDFLSRLSMSKVSDAGEGESLGSISYKNQRQEELLQPNAFFGPEVFELNAHAIRPNRADHSRA